MDNIIIDDGNGISLNGFDSLYLGDTDIITESETTQGPPGPQGPAGRDATVTVGSTTTGAPGTYASVTNSSQDPSAAVLEFTIPRGADGQDGQDGVSPTITVGTTTTVDPEDPATVTNSGTSENIVLDFEIPKGVTGNTGPAGADGISPIAYVEPITGGGRLIVEDSQSTTTVDIMNGQDGQDGAAATITVGSTTTGNPGTNASVTNSGTTSAAVLEFTIPRGATGDTGPAGQDGRDGVDGSAATIAVGTTTTGNPGTNASVTNTGTSSAAVFNFTIPRGADGQNGQDGAPGSAATIAVGNVSTGAAGSSASVTNTGTSSAAVFDFVIPRGDTGSTGPSGSDGQAATITVGSTTTGPAGSSASVTNTGTTSAAVLDFVIPKGDTGATGASGKGVVDYSTSEVDTGVKWVDGSTLYRKVLNFGALPNATQKSMAHGVSGINLHKMTGIARNPNSGITFILPTLSTSFGACITMYADNTNIYIDTQSTNRSAYTECYVIIEYTK